MKTMTYCFMFFIFSAMSQGALSLSAEADDSAGKVTSPLKLRFLSESALELSLLHPSGTDPFDDTFEFKLVSSTELDPVFLDYSQAVKRYQTIDDPWVESRWVALFDPTQLRPHQLQIHWKPELGAPVQVLRAQYDPQQVTGSIQLNQVGYLPFSPKKAWIGHWSGERPVPVRSTQFEVFDARNHQSVYQGDLGHWGQDPVWSGSDLYTADFSNLQKPGRYYLSVESLGRSYEFEVGSRVLEPVAHATFQLLYHHRNWTGADLQNENDAVLPFVDGFKPEYNGVFHEAIENYPLATGERAGEYRPVIKGWFDAGDFGQYVTNAAMVWFWSSLANDVNAFALTSDHLGIPESGNGVPDLIDELNWGFDWAASMQAPDGGVYFRIASERWDSELPYQVSKPRFIYQKTSHATASFAALAAIHSRLVAPYNPQKAEQSRQAAKRAWEYLQIHPAWPAEGEVYRNPEGTSAGDFPDKSSIDNQVWAASELYRLTGEQRFADYFEASLPKMTIDPTQQPYFARLEMAAIWSWIYAGADGNESHERALKVAKAALDWRVKEAQQLPYNAMMHHFYGWLGWGSFAHSTRSTVMLLAGAQLFDQPAYREWALVSPDIQLGNNPLNLSFLTGFGSQQVQYPLSKLQQFIPLAKPIPGLPVNGPHARLPNWLQALKRVNELYHPSILQDDKATIKYPAMRRYLDSDLIPPTSEPTVAEYAHTTMAYLLLSHDAAKLR